MGREITCCFCNEKFKLKEDNQIEYRKVGDLVIRCNTEIDKNNALTEKLTTEQEKRGKVEEK